MRHVAALDPHRHRLALAVAALCVASGASDARGAEGAAAAIDQGDYREAVDLLLESNRETATSPRERRANLWWLTVAHAESEDPEGVLRYGLPWLGDPLDGDSPETLRADRARVLLWVAIAHGRQGDRGRGRESFARAQRLLNADTSALTLGAVELDALAIEAATQLGLAESPSGAADRLAADPNRLLELRAEERCAAVLAATKSLEASDREGAALRLAEAVIDNPAWRPSFSSRELIQLLAAGASMARNENKPATSQRWINAALDLAAEPTPTSGRVDGLLQRAGALEWKATLLESRAELAEGDARKADLAAATGAFESLLVVADSLTEEDADLRARNRRVANRESIGRAAEGFRDTALAGLQRVLTLLLQSDDAAPAIGSRAAWSERRLETARELHRCRSERLLPSDPRLLEAVVGLATVLSAEARYDEATALFQSMEPTLQSGGDPTTRRRILLGWASTLLGGRRPDDAKRVLNRAGSVDDVADAGDVDVRILNTLGLAALLLGDYQSAELRLLEASQLVSRVADAHGGPGGTVVAVENGLYSALLAGAQGDNNLAISRIAEARRQAGGKAMTRARLALDLTESSLRLLALERGRPVGSRANDLHRVEGLLAEWRRSDSLSPKTRKQVDLLWADCRQLAGQGEDARQEYLALAQQAGNDPLVRVHALRRLARLELAASPRPRWSSGPAQYHADKVRLHGSLSAAIEHLQAAVTVLERLDAATRDERSGSAVASYPNQRFRVLSEAGRLLDARHRLELEFQTPALAEAGSPPFSQGGRAALDRAIDLLEQAIDIAEAPVGSTTHSGLQRSQYFTRFAPTYDLLIDLLVRRATGAAAANAPFVARGDELAFTDLSRAIEVADLARNRTFREQFASRPQAAALGGKRFTLRDAIGVLAPSSEALAVYHLGGVRWRRQAGDLATDTGAGRLFLVTDGGQTIRVYRLRTAGSDSDLSRSEAAALATEYLSYVNDSSGDEPFLATDRRRKHAIGKAIFPPDAREVVRTAGVSGLTVVTDGALHQIAFEALIDRKSNGEYCYAFEVLPPLRYAPSLSVMAAARGKPTDWRGSAVAAGSPLRLVSLGAPAGQVAPPTRLEERFRDLGPLPAAREECQRVARAWSDFASGDEEVVLALGAEATERRLREEAPAARLLHIAAHAIVDHEGDNLLGAVVLTPGPGDDPGNDGMLSVGEWRDLDLSNCELAILSGCETLVGANRPLEAGMSLARTLLESGSTRVVCSQWPISDRASAELVSTFCGALAPGSTDVAAALRDAKLKLVRGERPEWREPFYWAPLVLVGPP